MTADSPKGDLALLSARPAGANARHSCEASGRPFPALAQDPLPPPRNSPPSPRRGKGLEGEDRELDSTPLCLQLTSSA